MGRRPRGSGNGGSTCAGVGDRGFSSMNRSRDENGSDRIMPLPHPHPYFFVGCGADIIRMQLRMWIFSDVGYGAESDPCRSGCGLI
jgi:hypothetical protein